MNSRMPLRAALLVLCGLLLVALLLLWLLPDGEGRPRYRWVAPPAQPPALENLNVVLPPPVAAAPAAYPATLQRPLFTETRRPAPAPQLDAAASAPAAPSPSDDLDKTQMLGLMKGSAFVGVLARVDGKVRTVRRGDTIGPWKLDTIRDREVVFIRDGSERVLKLEYAHASGAAPDGVASQAAPARPPAPPPPALAPVPTAPPAPPAPPAAELSATTPPRAQPAADPWTSGSLAPRAPAASAPGR